MLNCTDLECILHHHHYYAHLHHLKHGTHVEDESAMSTDGEDAIQQLLNDTDSELSGLSHLDAPNESLYMIGGVLIAMVLVGVIIILLAVTIRNEPDDQILPELEITPSGFLIGRISIFDPCLSSATKRAKRLDVPFKLRKREEHTNVVHPADVVMQTTTPSVPSPPPPPPQTVIGGVMPQTTDQESCRGQFMWQFPPPQPQHVYSNNQDTLVQTIPTERPGFVQGFRKNLGGRWRRFVKRKPTPDVYTIPPELRPQLKTIYVY